MAAVIAIFVFLTACKRDEGHIDVTNPDPFTISVQATMNPSGGIRVAITADFNALNTPLWRTDSSGYLAHFDLESNTPSVYIDTNVLSGSTYCYMAGGNYFLIGTIYSNQECITYLP